MQNLQKKWTKSQFFKKYSFITSKSMFEFISPDVQSFTSVTFKTMKQTFSLYLWPENYDKLGAAYDSKVYNDVDNEIDLTSRTILNALYYVCRIPFWMLSVNCIVGINIYYQIKQHSWMPLGELKSCWGCMQDMLILSSCAIQQDSAH